MLKTFDGQRTLLNMLKTYDFDEGTIESWHPLALAAKANDADTPNWNQAMNGPNAEGFWKACEKELDTLQSQWNVIVRPDAADWNTFNDLGERWGYCKQKIYQWLNITLCS